MGALASSSLHCIPKTSGEDANTALSSAGLLILHLLDLPAPMRFPSQRLNAAWIHQRPARTCTAVVSFLCRTVSCRPAAILRSCSPCTFHPQVRLMRNVALRAALLSLLKGFTSISRSWLLRLVPVEEASTWVSNLNSADTTSAFGIVCSFQTLIKNALRLFLRIQEDSDQERAGDVGK